MNFNEFIQKRPDFYLLTQKEQVKYIAYLLYEEKPEGFTLTNLREYFDKHDLITPSNIARETVSLTLGKIPILVRKKSGFAFHPRAKDQITRELDDIIPDINFDSVPFRITYDFHPEISRVSLDQLREGHYKEAIQNALVEVIDQVKKKTGKLKNSNGKDLDGDDLMNRVFGCDGNNTPLIQFNDLSDGLEKAEQRGIMNLFKGIVGIRDKKAHLNFVQNDPLKAIEYMALASLLMRLLDDNIEK